MMIGSSDRRHGTLSRRSSNQCHRIREHCGTAWNPRRTPGCGGRIIRRLDSKVRPGVAGPGRPSDRTVSQPSSEAQF
eukprot:749423-Hanusia_phi.AAC.1